MRLFFWRRGWWLDSYLGCPWLFLLVFILLGSFRHTLYTIGKSWQLAFLDWMLTFKSAWVLIWVVKSHWEAGIYIESSRMFPVCWCVDIAQNSHMGLPFVSGLGDAADMDVEVGLLIFLTGDRMKQPGATRRFEAMLTLKEVDLALLKLSLWQDRAETHDDATGRETQGKWREGEGSCRSDHSERAGPVRGSWVALVSGA